MTECSRCGDCCENIHVGSSPESIARWAFTPMGPDKWTAFNSNIQSTRFILNVWENTGPNRYECPKFDKVNRLCTAHDERPPICSGFPWYGNGPVNDPGRLPARCSFNADTRTNLPIVRITNGTAKHPV